MKKRSYFNLFLTFTGTVLLIWMSSVVAANFSRDAGLLKKPLLSFINAAGEEKQAGENENGNENGADPVEEGKTIKLDGGSESTTAGKSSSEEEKPETPDKIRVEVINYTGDPGLLEEAVSALETAGYAAAGREDAGLDTGTLIISRNDNDAAERVRAILKAGRAIKWPDEKSQFDVTVKLGDDYSP